MLRLSFLVLFIAVCIIYAADHETFKDCSRVEFCSNLRTKKSVPTYNVDLSSLNIDTEPGVAILTLFAPGKTNLTLTLSCIYLSWRIKIQEVNSKRYELKDVLEKEPVTHRFDEIRKGRNNLEFVHSYVRMTVNASPFNIQFFTSGTLEAEFDGSTLVFEDNPSQAFAFGVSFPESLQIYGIHEHADKLALRTTASGGSDPYRLRNLDVAGYELNSPMSLYGAVPVLYAHGPTVTSGVFLHNAAEQWVDITKGANTTGGYFMVESGTLDLFVLSGPRPREVVEQYVALTGKAHLPQLWALGYHQCRWNYESQDDLKTVVANFNKYNFPLDVIWLDIEYTDGKKYFTWNPENFTDPLEMQKNISASHKRLVTIIDPHIKAEKGYPVYDGALQNDLFVKNADGSVFEGVCWPGVSSYMDFLNPAARSYYANFYSYENFPNTTAVLAGIWNDMNEPSVFDDSLEKTLPGDALHHNGVVHRDIHNIYGFLHTMSTHQGLLARDNGATRPFILTRSHFAGSQRYAAIWTGDNTADWGYVAVSYSECLNANLLGIVFCGADVGGFFNDPDEELLQRWYQAGVWLPFYRAHANMGTARREPYLFDKDVQDVIRNAIQLRYKHLPVWYTLFFEHTRLGEPVIRPLFYHYPTDINILDIDDQLLVGRNILVKAVTEPGVKSVKVYFPGGENELWLSISNLTEVFPGTGFVDIPVDLKSIPVYYRRGSVIVRKETSRLSSDEMADDGHTLHALIGEDGKATGTVYLDDNTSFNYQTKFEYSYLNIEVDDKEVKLSQIDIRAVPTAFPFIIKEVHVHKVKELPKNGQPGTYTSVVYKKNAGGAFLSTLQFNVENEITFILSE